MTESNQMTWNTKEYNEPKKGNVFIKKEFAEPLEIDVENIKQEIIFGKRPYYQCITCNATFTKVDKLKDHISIHEGERFANVHYFSITF